MDLERGITIKVTAVKLHHRAENENENENVYELNLIEHTIEVVLTSK